MIEHKTNFKLLYQEFLANDVNIISKPQKPIMAAMNLSSKILMVG
ncbi:hypothetical protein [Iocasia frigidifontis]|nr:hypothetical protein [Iocasia fonsfrigidae]